MSKELLNQEAEIAVLSILLTSPGKIFELEDLKSFMLSVESHKLLFDIIFSIYQDGLVPEYSLLISILNSKNIINDCGGENYIKFLYNQKYDENNLNEFEKLIVKTYKSRAVLSLSSQIPNLVDNKDDIDNTISYIRTTLDNLTLVNGGDSVSDVNIATKEMWETLKEKVNNPNKIGYSTGFKNLDTVTGGYWSGDLWTVAGRPGTGKTSWACNSLLKSDYPVLIFSLEMQREVLAQRFVSIMTGIPLMNIRMGIVTQEQLDLISDTIKLIKEKPIYIDSNYFNNINYVTSTIRKYQKLYGIKAVHLDYLQLLVERGLTATHDLGVVTRELKLLSNSLGITTVVYSQLNRLVETRDDKRPILSDLRQSGNIEEDVDVAVFLYRDILYNKDTKHKDVMEQIIRKQRNGPIGTIMSKFTDDSNRIEDYNG